MARPPTSPPAMFQFVPSRGGQHSRELFLPNPVPVSIRALTRRATRAPRDTGSGAFLFQFVPSRGGQPPSNVNDPMITLVSIRALTRRATRAPRDTGRVSMFQFVPSRGGQPTACCCGVMERKFQFVPSRGGQRFRFPLPQDFHSFNSCPHAEGNAIQILLLNVFNGFNSCPHAEGNRLPSVPRVPEPVSIRALTRRATPPPSSVQISRDRFQFVPSRGGQHCHFKLLYRAQPVSIRALTRRATPPPQAPRLLLFAFQFVPSRGGQQSSSPGAATSPWFQFVPSRGGQHDIRMEVYNRSSFNSCPHAEGNVIFKRSARAKIVSIRALTRRATYVSRLLQHLFFVSIRALTRRATFFSASASSF